MLLMYIHVAHDVDKIYNNKIGNDEIYKDLFSGDEISTLKNNKPEWKKIARKYVDNKINIECNCMPMDMLIDSMLPKCENDILFGMLIKNKYKLLYDCSRKYMLISDEMIYFPVALFEWDESEIVYDNTWNCTRTYGGERNHEGCDIFTQDKRNGYYPVVSVCDGVVEQMGWLELGGYRIGIRSNSGTYYYYAHLDSYAQDIRKGQNVMAGQFLGFMGDTGYGEECTRGKFDVHLHFGIYVDDDTSVAINPYYFLKSKENECIVYSK